MQFEMVDFWEPSSSSEESDFDPDTSATTVNDDPYGHKAKAAFEAASDSAESINPLHQSSVRRRPTGKASNWRRPARKAPLEEPANFEDLDSIENKDNEEEFQALRKTLLEYVNEAGADQASANVKLFRSRILAIFTDRARSLVNDKLWMSVYRKQAAFADSTVLTRISLLVMDIDQITQQLSKGGYYENSPRGSIYKQFWNEQLGPIVYSICKYISGDTMDGGQQLRLFKISEFVSELDGFNLPPDSAVYEEVRTEAGFALKEKNA